MKEGVKISNIKMNRSVLGLIAVIVFVTVIGVYSFFKYSPECQSYDCFQSKMKSCSSVSYINDQPEAIWKYVVQGRDGGICKIEVTLVHAKKGELGIDKFEKMSMLCEYPYGFASYPEKDISKCHGRLKEELQNLIINKLHSYIIENLGKFNDELNKPY